MVMVAGILVGGPWASWAEDKPSVEEEKPATTTTADEDTKFQGSLNSLGLTAGWAGKCSEKNPETVEQITAQALAAANQLVQLFGTDAAFRFVFHAGLGGAGAKLDTAKCAQYIADWSDFVKKHPELAVREIKESK
jgi:ABC-type phosphate transport system substrate-binding protein